MEVLVFAALWNTGISKFPLELQGSLKALSKDSKER